MSSCRINTSSELNPAARACSRSRSDQVQSQQQTVMKANVLVVVTSIVLPTVTLKAQLRATTMTKRAAELTRLDVHPQAKHPRGQECCCYRENCITIGLCITRFRCIGFSRWMVSAKPDAKSLGTDSKNTVHKVYITSSECEKKGPSLGNIKVKLQHQ